MSQKKRECLKKTVVLYGTEMCKFLCANADIALAIYFSYVGDFCGPVDASGILKEN